MTKTTQVIIIWTIVLVLCGTLFILFRKIRKLCDKILKIANGMLQKITSKPQ